MVDPISLTLGAAVATLIAKAAETTGEKLTAGGVEAMARLRGRLRARFGNHDDSGEGFDEQVLVELEEVPDSPRRVQHLAQVVDRLATEDAAFGAELAALVRSVQDAGVEVQTINQRAQGQGNVQVAGVDSSTLSVSYGQPPSRPHALPSPPDDWPAE